MNHAVFLGVLSGEPLFTNSFVQFSTLKQPPPPKSKTKQTPKQSNKNPQILQNTEI